MTASFERLGWGVAENARHDIGTDLYLSPRDQRLFESGLLVGAQVKTGKSFFRERILNDGQLAGWWFRDSDRSHVDAWATHVIPHLIILHDPETQTSYWQHVTIDRIVQAGRGAKVSVPVSNNIDEANRETLLAVAATVRPGTAWEGSAWTGAADLAPNAVLRHALIVPRLVAPHSNAGYEVEIEPEQAVALLAQARVRDLDRFAELHQGVPNISQAGSSAIWAWRFVGALGQYLSTGNVDFLLTIGDDAPDSAGRTAAGVVATSGLMAEGRPDEAIEVLERILALDDADPVDHAWLSAQHGRACVELGRIDEAQVSALKAQEIRIEYPDDVTATGLAGVASSLIFSTASWDKRDLGNVIANTDTTAAWWRTQTKSGGLEALAEREFKLWTRDTSVTFGGSDDAHNKLFVASFAANNLGDQGAWKHTSALLGEDTLLRLGRDGDPKAARDGLSLLRLAGDDKILVLATKRLMADGPYEAVRLAAADVDLEKSTHTSGACDLALLQHGGELLDEDAADLSIDWLLATLMDPDGFAQRTSPTYWLEPRLLDTLAGLVPAASRAKRGKVLERLVELPGQDDQLVANAWARILQAFPDTDWDEETVDQLSAGADAQHDVLRLAMLDIANRFGSSAYSRLLGEVKSGSFAALDALGGYRELDSDIVAGLAPSVIAKVNGLISDAHQSTFKGYTHDAGIALALLNVWHGDSAGWETLLRLLEDKRVPAQNKRGALRVLARHVDRVPHEVRLRLVTLVRSETTKFPTMPGSPFSDDGDISGPLTEMAIALDVLDEDDSAFRLLTLIEGDTQQRHWACEIAYLQRDSVGVGVLVTLSKDREPQVRASAAAGLAALVAGDLGGALAKHGLRRCLVDTGILVPVAIASVLVDSSEQSPASREALITLRSHASARVRSLASKGAFENDKSGSGS